MKYLLDTNAFLRIVNGDPLPRGVRRALDRTGNEFVFSIVSGWEIMMKPSLNLTAGDVAGAISAMGTSVLPIEFSHLEAYSSLAVREDHRDPFDRMLISQALAEDLTVITSDARFGEYARLRVIWD